MRRGVVGLWRRGFCTGRFPRVRDGLTRSVVQLELDRRESVTMYVCGPTVYDAAHLGHARTYVQFDMIRRVLRDVFGFNVAFFMNVTDVDDKIVQRARELGVDWRQHAASFEEEFVQDMVRLGVELPTFSPRATDYVDEIIAHICSLQEKGLAYESNGSVYFDLEAFDKQNQDQPQHRYGALDPSRALDREEEEEEQIDGGVAATHRAEKKNARDFALWKSVPAEELVFWESPWGRGRPGWHAECAAMVACTAGSVKGDGRLDIHGGGVDLKFPHHENERAQGQGLCCDHNQQPWTRFFLHTGHLYIQGLKMSKSLKNFITIRQLLDGYDTGAFKMTPRQARLMFLSHKYNDRMDLSQESMREAAQLDAFFNEFFLFVSHQAKANATLDAVGIKWDAGADSNTLKETHTYSDRVLDALVNDFDTPAVLRQTQQFVSQMNRYARDHGAKNGVLLSAARTINRTLETLGIGGAYSGVPGYTEGAQHIKTDDTAKVMNAFVKFRTRVRQGALEQDFRSILQACDQIRDVDLPAIGFRLNDSGDSTLWVRNSSDQPPPPSPPPLSEQQQDQAPIERVIKPSNLFRFQTEKYSLFDAEGVPTHYADKTPLSKSAQKKLKKEMRIAWKRYKKQQDDDKTLG